MQSALRPINDRLDLVDPDFAGMVMDYSALADAASAAAGPGHRSAATLGGNLPGLIDPGATAEDDEISWTSTTIREGLNGAFSYDQLRHCIRKHALMEGQE